MNRLRKDHHKAQTSASYDGPDEKIAGFSSTTRQRRRIVFGGRVQSVGFRYHCESAAGQAGVSGWVKNLIDGTVLCEIEGEPQQIDAFFAELDEQSTRAWFRHHVVSNEPIALEASTGFSIKY